MKIKKKNITTAVDVFISNDGLEFSNQEECLEYEKFLTEISKTLEPVNYGPNLCHNASCDRQYQWFNPKTVEDISLIFRFMDKFVNSSDIYFNIEYLNKWVCFETTGNEICTVTTFEDEGMNAIKEFAERFGYDVAFTKKEGN